MLKQKIDIVLSPHLEVYDLVIPKDNMLRKINKLIDFSFIYVELVTVYFPDNR